jgi:carboxypeptidase C (cathepsin A)
MGSTNFTPPPPEKNLVHMYDIGLQVGILLRRMNKYFYNFRDFYIFGESYGGKYVPALSHRIRNANIDPNHFGGPVKINLMGLGIGNGWMSPLEQGKYASYLYYHGLLDGEQYLTLLALEDDLVAKVYFRNNINMFHHKQKM